VKNSNRSVLGGKEWANTGPVTKTERAGPPTGVGALGAMLPWPVSTAFSAANSPKKLAKSPASTLRREGSWGVIVFSPLDMVKAGTI